MALGGLDSAISVARSMRLAKHSEGLLANPIICGSRVECSDKKERKQKKNRHPRLCRSGDVPEKDRWGQNAIVWLGVLGMTERFGSTTMIQDRERHKITQEIRSQHTDHEASCGLTIHQACTSDVSRCSSQVVHPPAHDNPLRA